MWMLDADRKQGVDTLQLYLTPAEAARLRDDLGSLLTDPEKNAHLHLFDEGKRDLSFSIVTPRKLESDRYTDDERRLLDE
jgi:hypothetical protein